MGSGTPRTPLGGCAPTPRRLSGQARVGLPIKVALILATVVVAVAACGGGLYLRTSDDLMRSSDRRQARQIAHGMALAAKGKLNDRNITELHELLTGAVQAGPLRFASLVDADGRTLTAAVAPGEAGRWAALAAHPSTFALTEQVGQSRLVLARPIVTGGGAQGTPRLEGALRIVLDTSATAAGLREAYRRTILIAASLCAAALPLGYLLTWRVVIRPVRALSEASRRLAAGDCTTRADRHGNDEIGDLASCFDSMAGQIGDMRGALIAANERLERQVSERTQELRVTNRRLCDEIEEKEDFLRAVSHDLNAPLRNIGGMVSAVLTREEAGLSEDAVRRLGRVQANVRAGSEMIADLLELSRVKSRPQRRQAVEFGEMLRSLAGGFEYESQTKSIRLTVGREMPVLEVEKNRVRQLFQNLLDNAVKYMHRSEGGRIDVAWRREPGGHHFTVADNGPGIPAEQQKGVFCVFRRGESPQTARVDGRGVGLALVKAVAANHGGRAWVESETGRGATFHVVLNVPVARPTATLAMEVEHADT